MIMISRRLSSLHKVYPDWVPQTDYCGGTVLCNEPFSFQVAYKQKDGEAKLPVYVQVESDLPIASYRVDYVPLYTGFNPGSDGGEERTTPGLYPDVLQPRQTNSDIVCKGQWKPRYFEDGESNLLTAVPLCWQSLWFTVNEKGESMQPGEYLIRVKIYSQDDKSLQAQEQIILKILPEDLDPQTLLCTNWYYADCMCDQHDVELYSDRFFEILESYANMAAKHGQNMILTPAFTPPLGTPIGMERRDIQLVGITASDTAEGRKYEFDFSLLKRFVDVCRKGGITHFEHCHLFTQWGAKCAPNIRATVNGEVKRILGWDTAADSEEYVEFLAQYIPAVRTFLRQEGLEQNTLFHISDEPGKNEVESYGRAQAVAMPLLEGCMVGDALSHYIFYEKGLTQMPIVATDHIEDFIGKCDNLWCYYTGIQVNDGLSNRVISMPSARNRVIGMQMYRYNIKGFLHWGYNHCYGPLGQGKYDPFSFPGGWDMIVGSGYIVYPGRDGRALPSLRIKIMQEGINDMRALQTLERLTDRPTVCDLLDRLFGGKLTFHSCPASAEELLAIRQSINEAIEQCLC